MKQNTNNERKSLKDVLAENKGKIVAGTIAIAAGVAAYVIYKDSKRINELTEVIVKNDETLDMMKLAISHNTDQAYIAKDIAKEGALEEAIVSLKRKIQYRVGKIADLKIRPLDEDAMLSKTIHEKELEVLKAKLQVFEDEWYNMIH